VIRDTLNLPATRSWRDIPQPVVPRAMSREGRWRLVMATLRIVALVAVGLVFAWGGWLIFVSLHANVGAMPAAAKSTPLKQTVLRTDGVLDQEWLTRTLALPPHASLVELDLQQLRSRLMGDQQVINATLTKSFPDRLLVQVSERTPVARVMARWLGEEHELLVSREGVIYTGRGYDQSLIDTLPWLDGVSITPDGGVFKPIEGMTQASELLAKARLETENLYADWGVVSLARLQSDHKIEIRTKSGSVVFFSTNDDFFRQLARLDYIVEQLARVPGAKARIDLSLGADVPVTVIPPAPDAETPPAAAPEPVAASTVAERAGAQFGFDLNQTAGRQPRQAFFTLPFPQPSTTKREL
jgi:cell division protein FtsQ